jgi:hypothetical protein
MDKNLILFQLGHVKTALEIYSWSLRRTTDLNNIDLLLNNVDYTLEEMGVLIKKLRDS